MADEKSGPTAVVVAMKGHPGSGKSTAARAIAAALRCPLLDKDDVRDCTLQLEGAVAAGTLNELSYAVLWRVVERQVRLGLSVVVDSPLSRRAHLEALARLPAALLLIVECRAVDEEEWRQRLEERGASVAGGDGWHKPRTWAELEKLLEGYQGCTDYDIGDVPRIVVDTTDPMIDAEAIAAKVSVQDGIFCSEFWGVCYFAGAGAILEGVQARDIPSGNWKSSVIRCGHCNCGHSRWQREPEGRHTAPEGRQLPQEFGVPVHRRAADPPRQRCNSTSTRRKECRRPRPQPVRAVLAHQTAIPSQTAERNMIDLLPWSRTRDLYNSSSLFDCDGILDAYGILGTELDHLSA